MGVGGEDGALETKIPGETNHTDPGVARGELLDLLKSAIGRMIVGEEELEIIISGKLGHYWEEGLVERLDVLLFIEDGDANGDQFLFFRHASHRSTHIARLRATRRARVRANVARTGCGA